MRIAAGILMILGGLIGGSLLLGFLNSLHIYGTLLILPSGLAGIGGVYTLMGRRWGWALTGAICSLLFPLFGIPAIILLLKSKGEFA